jgi:hypothetical protein
VAENDNPPKPKKQIFDYHPAIPIEPSAKEKAAQRRKISSWAATSPDRVAVARRKVLLESLIKFVHASGGFVRCRAPMVVRTEVPIDSDLPTKLEEVFGYCPILCGRTMRTTGGGFLQVDVIELILDK